jgi:formylglycine-generating enzyme required for sulfatase activity
VLRRAAPWLLAAALLGGDAACRTRPLALGEALLVVDTDAAIPRHVNRLRVDVFGGDGVLLETRDIIAPRPEDWPISFSVVADREGLRAASVRLRAYAEGHVVTHAEAVRDGGPSEPTVFATIEAACQEAPTLELGRPLTSRRGAVPITTVLPYAPAAPDAGADAGVDAGAGIDAGVDCTQPTRAGSVVAKIAIADRDRYRFEIVSGVPNGAHRDPGGDTTLSLRKDCLFPTSQLVCNDDITTDNHLSAFELTLDAGTYWLVTGGADPAPADLTLLATRVSAPLTASPQPPPGVADETLEPARGATIDRLVRLQLLQGYRGTVPITLAGECFGVAADVTAGLTCIDRAGERVAPPPVIADGELTRAPARPAPWAAESAEPCTAVPRPASPLLDEEACIPGGSFVMGDPLALADLDFRGHPERMRVVPAFLLDRFEFTVGRYREALRKGFPGTPGDPLENPGPIAAGAGKSACTYTSGASNRESFPLTCVSLRQARALCNFFGGDLPTEDQWEFAATAAARPAETQYPWGQELPTCERAVLERSDTTAKRCAPAYGPVAVDDPAFAGDRSPQGVMGLGGNVQEWLSTGFYPYAHGVWETAGLRAPLSALASATAPLQSTRGGDWAGPGLYASSAVRRALPPLGIYDNAGFRCARPGK